MNKRIEKIKQQAMTVQGGDITFNGGQVELVDLDRFAQLIVLECEAYVAERFDSSEPWMRPGGLSRHFGVE